MVSVVSPVNYRILRAVLSHRLPFTQSEIAKTAAASAPQTSRIVRWLAELSGVERLQDGRYVVRGPATIVTSAFPYQRSMSDAHRATVRVRGSRRQITESLVSLGGILCLENALEEYSEYFRPSRICIYHRSPEQVVKAVVPREGGIIPVHVYVPDIPLEGDVEEGRRTSKYRTLIDLVCDGNAYAAKDLFEALWGVVLE